MSVTPLLRFVPPSQMPSPRALHPVAPQVQWSHTLELAEHEAFQLASSLVQAKRQENTSVVEQGKKRYAWPSSMEKLGETNK